MNGTKTVVLALIISIELASCSREPKFSTTPAISFKEIKQFTIRDMYGNSNIDSLAIIIHYQDGDADLGVSQAEINTPPWQGKLNGEVKTLVKRGGQYVPLTDILGHEIDNSWIFAPTGKVEGELVNPYPWFHAVSYPLKDTVKFQVRILDRAMHASNWIETTPVIVNRQD